MQDSRNVILARVARMIAVLGLSATSSLALPGVVRHQIDTHLQVTSAVVASGGGPNFRHLTGGTP